MVDLNLFSIAMHAPDALLEGAMRRMVPADEWGEFMCSLAERHMTLSDYVDAVANGPGGSADKCGCPGGFSIGLIAFLLASNQEFKSSEGF